MNPFKMLWETSSAVCEAAPAGWSGSCTFFWFWAFNLAIAVLLVAFVVGQVRSIIWKRAEQQTDQYADHPEAARQNSTALETLQAAPARVEEFHHDQAGRVAYDEYKEARDGNQFDLARRALRRWRTIVAQAPGDTQLKRDRRVRFEAEIGGAYLTEALHELKNKSSATNGLLKKAISHLKRAIVASALEGDLAALSFCHARLAVAMQILGKKDKAAEYALRARALAKHTRIEGFRTTLDDFLDGGSL